jgi:hypothetical protein
MEDNVVFLSSPDRGYVKCIQDDTLEPDEVVKGGHHD